MACAKSPRDYLLFDDVFTDEEDDDTSDSSDDEALEFKIHSRTGRSMRSGSKEIHLNEVHTFKTEDVPSAWSNCVVVLERIPETNTRPAVAAVDSDLLDCKCHVCLMCVPSK